MIQINYNEAFCNQHEDYLYEILRIDYLTDRNCKLCKRCRAECLQIDQQEVINTQEQLEVQKQKLQIVQEQSLKDNLNKKIDQFCQDLKDKIQTQMMQLVTNFIEVKNNLLKKSNEDMKSYIANNKQTVIEDTINVKSKVVDIIYDAINQVDIILFPEILFDQKLDKMRLPSLDDIISKCNSYNLLLKFQVLLDQLKYLKQNEFDNLYSIDAKNFEEELQQQSLRLENLEMKLQYQLNEETKKLLKRFERYKVLKNQNTNVMKEFVQQLKNTKNLQIQEIQTLDLNNLGKHEQVFNYFQQLKTEQKIYFSRLAHLGKIDITISEEQIQSCFEFDFIPIIINNQNTENIKKINIPRLQIEIPEFRHEVRVNGQLNNRGELDGNITTVDDQRRVGLTQMQNGQVVTQNKQFENSQLLQLNLQFITQSNQNYFNFTHYRDSEKEVYEEQSKKWTLSRNLKSMFWEFKIGNQTFENLRLKDEQIDENYSVKYTCHKEKNNIIYKGKINSSFQFHDTQGQLEENNIIKIGNWKEGQLQGQGQIQKNQQLLYKGNFVNSQRSGQGIEYLTQIYFYEGEFKDDKKHGKGTIKKKLQDNSIVNVEECRYENDVPILGNNPCEIF